MSDNLNDLFEEINKIDQPANQSTQSGAFTRREMRVEMVNGVERVMQIVRIQVPNPDGFLNIIEEIRYLCQGCNSKWVALGADSFTNDGKILCEKCSHKAKVMSFLKPLWSLFVKFEEKK
jgi:DNA-directed RNA polymerase subunit RPC12/RpoP